MGVPRTADRGQICKHPCRRIPTLGPCRGTGLKSEPALLHPPPQYFRRVRIVSHWTLETDSVVGTWLSNLVYYTYMQWLSTTTKCVIDITIIILHYSLQWDFTYILIDIYCKADIQQKIGTVSVSMWGPIHWLLNIQYDIKTIQLCIKREGTIPY